MLLLQVHKAGNQGALLVKNPPANAGDPRDQGAIPGSGRYPGSGKPLQYPCLENSVDRGAWQVIEQAIAKSQTQLGAHVVHTHTHMNFRLYDDRVI